MKSQGFLQTPQDIVEEYNGCSVPQYTAYPMIQHACFRKSLMSKMKGYYGTATTSFGACGERGVVHINSERALCILHVSKSVFRLDLVAFR